MNRLIHELAKTIRGHVAEATRGKPGTNLESRFVFHGPPLWLLEGVLAELSQHGGIRLTAEEHGTDALLPVLLPFPEGQAHGPNPRIGESGACTDAHLLQVRNTPGKASFVALVPPSLHINASLDTTSAELGITPSNNTQGIPFEKWWNDGFVQHLALQGLRYAGLSAEETEEAMLLVELGAAACDHMDLDKGSREAAWRLITRIYSIPNDGHGLTPGQAVSLVCGFPPMQDGSVSAKAQAAVLAQIASAMSEGFRTTTDRLIENDCPADVADALRGFLEHLRQRCEVPSTFSNATPAFYLPLDSESLLPPPAWWPTLTVEAWIELLDDTHDFDDLAIACTNAILPPNRGQPSVVWEEVTLEVTSDSATSAKPLNVALSGGGLGKVPCQLTIPGNACYSETFTKLQRTPVNYKAGADGCKSVSIKVIPLSFWAPGIYLTCRVATKVSAPKKARNARSGYNWDSSMSLPGAGRYELLALVSPGTQILSAKGVPDDTMENMEREPLLEAREIQPGEYMVEAEVDGKMILEIAFLRAGSKQPEICRTLVTCDETKEEGCRSEFERLIRANRLHIDKGGKTVIQLDRNARLSSLQAWMLDERSVDRSFLPIVISGDYAETWAPPDWSMPQGPILSSASFLYDPRPGAAAFTPPTGFIEARREIAKRIRSSTDDNNGLVESSRLGAWLARDNEFRSLVEQYLDSYSGWLAADRDTACWIDTITVYQREGGGQTLARIPDATILSPLHPLRLAWHCLAQQTMYEETEGRSPLPCPAASVLDPDCVPDSMTLSLQSPGAERGIEHVTYVSLECNSDYWSVLWHGKRLDQITSRTQAPPFGEAFGLVVGGIATGFSPAQVGRALGDVTDLLGAKPIVSVAISSAGGTTDACNEGLAIWSSARFGNGGSANDCLAAGPRFLEIYDTRDTLRPDDAVIANLAEDTGGHVRWYCKQPDNSTPDLGIIAQLDSVQPDLVDTSTMSPLSWGGLIRHRVRRQLQGTFLSESRQAKLSGRSGDGLPDKLIDCMLAIESAPGGKKGIQFSPNVHAVTQMLEDRRASFVAVSSSTVDPACFLNGGMGRSYLWDYDLPAYSARAGDTSGYYLLSQIRDSDREALAKVLEPLPGCNGLPSGQVEEILLEVARRGIPTVRGLSGDDTGATGDLGLFLAVRLLQDQFRTVGNVEGLVPVLAGSEEDATVALVIPVDPFRGYLADLARSLGREKKETSLSRPDLLVAGIRLAENRISILLTPVEVKCRQGTILGSNDTKEALGQARALSSLFRALEERAAQSQLWRVAYQHLLLSMIGFGLRVYSQHPIASANQTRWAEFHERIAATVLGGTPGAIEIEDRGRLIVIDASPSSDCKDTDGDGTPETIVISNVDAGRIAIGDSNTFYDAVRKKVGQWWLLPEPRKPGAIAPQGGEPFPEAAQAPNTPADLPRATSDITQPPIQEHIVQTVTSSSDAHGDASPATGIILSVGRTVDGLEPRRLSLNISDTRLNQLNMGVVGDLGTGKTQLLKSLILQITRGGQQNRGIKPRFLIFDYKRDYSSPEFVEATGAKVVTPNRLPLNLFDISAVGQSNSPWLDRFRFFTDVLDKIYSGIGPVQRDKLKSAVRNAYDSCQGQGRQPTIYDIHAEYRELLGDKSDTPMAIIDDLVDMEIFERVPEKTKTFDEFLDGVVVVSLDALGQDDRSKNMLVAIMLNMFYENMLRTPKRPFVGSDPQLRVIDSYLLVDEADNIMRYEFDVLRKLLLQGREFGAGVILASQYLRHFKTSTTDYREPLLTWFIHKVPNVTPAELGALGFTSDLGDLAERVKTLQNHHCLYKSFDVPGEIIHGLPFFQLIQKGGVQS
ncbi:hypothetical protein [Thiobacillus sp.]|uniref:hypothetical protein n=1 Tax=Thiobacillus sp. TaxID=924 RepID=UPI0025DEEC02|nr:hypothetical protein [Thiobacillus sp.]